MVAFDPIVVLAMWDHVPHRLPVSVSFPAIIPPGLTTLIIYSEKRGLTLSAPTVFGRISGVQYNRATRALVLVISLTTSECNVGGAGWILLYLRNLMSAFRMMRNGLTEGGFRVVRGGGIRKIWEWRT